MSMQFIHAQEDVANIVRFADSIGLLLLPVRLGTENDTRPRKPEELESFSWGTLLFFRPEWVMDELIVDPGVGVFEGTYSVRGGVNMANVSISFGRDKDIAGVRQFGCGASGYERDWLDSKAHKVRLSPPEVAQTYKLICKELFSKVSVRGGVNNYHVCKHAAELATRIPTRPPFDYIPWPPPAPTKKTGK